MTAEEKQTATKIMKRLLNMEIAFILPKEMFPRVNKLAAAVMTAWAGDDYEAFLVPAKELNGIYKTFTQPEISHQQAEGERRREEEDEKQMDHWEIGGDR
jgi:hypothetical protein